MKIYVASSWRNAWQPMLVEYLRKEGYEVYDFRHPPGDGHGFHWSEIAPDWRKWRLSEFAAGLQHPLAAEGFQSDLCGMQWADVCVLLLPCGRSAHLEAGWFVGAGKAILVFDPSGEMEPELMYRMADGIYGTIHDLLGRLAEIEQ